MLTICCKFKVPPSTAVFFMSLLALIVLLITVSFNIVSVYSEKVSENILGKRNLTETYDYVATEMTIPKFAFLIWILIYIWQAMWVIMILIIALFRYKYVPISYFAFILYFTFNILGSLFIISLCHLQLVLALIIMIINVVLSNICFMILKKTIYSCKDTDTEVI